ncbi:SDR family NAD(P)-dependent oxidoreductase [Bradyrhizobium brasilense]|uniref:SDR family NAD(P)-dependent oxidoreductase n=1 Tax=Bradyrhizobium brasilense TaxID=1419277 RepID=UPI0028775892|nr:SDR family NAD(P)-dependent oxidoreductase [Bradyrhizobium brasilense]MCP3414450.1 SDR family NAD(P)-dependent oxidoreductase [Bradyrhizobium brasilense]
MRELAGKAAFVTGAASGIGLAMATAFAREGMKVMLADIETGPLDKAVDALRAGGADVHGVVCDVADPVSVDRAAEASFRAFGKIHVLCNNAGVAAGGGIDPISVDDWRWVIDVNLMGVVHGIRSFLSHIRGHGEGGHIVNTASMAGMNAGLGLSPYSATKFAVVSLSEGLAMQLRPLGIGVSVLCPSFVRTRIGESGRNRGEQYGPTRQLDPASPMAAVVAEIARRLEAGLDPASAAGQVLAAIRDDQFYIFTHPGMRAEVEQRFSAILAAMDAVSA